jgi:hypothetical protein
MNVLMWNNSTLIVSCGNDVGLKLLKKPNMPEQAPFLSAEEILN